MKGSKKTLSWGIFYGASAGFFWGLPFLIPQMLGHYSALEIAFGRFFFFGVMSLFFYKPVLQVWKVLPRVGRWKLLALTFTGFWGYSMLLFWSVQKTDGVVSSLIIGLLPVTIPLLAMGKRFGGRGFYFGLGLIVIGLINLFWYSSQETASVGVDFWKGVLGLTVCLGLWTFYANANSKFLKEYRQVSSRNLSSAVGVISLLCMTPIFFSQVDYTQFVYREDFSYYLVASFGLGAGASWFANWLWNLSSSICPSEISGPLIVTETIFGLLYTFMYQKRMPYSYEVATMVLFSIGVILAVKSQVKSHAQS